VHGTTFFTVVGLMDGRIRGRRGHVLVGGGALILVLAAIPACSSTSAPTAAPTTTSTSAPPVTFEQGSAAAVDDCEADAKVLEVAIDVSQAVRGSYPTPPLPWNAVNYAANFAPLTSGSAGGPFMHSPPSTDDYVVEYDSAGHIWVAPPATYDAAYNPAQDFDTNPDSCLAAVR
jgi:hypothetical protein